MTRSSLKSEVSTISQIFGLWVKHGVPSLAFFWPFALIYLVFCCVLYYINYFGFIFPYIIISIISFKKSFYPISTNCETYNETYNKPTNLQQSLSSLGGNCYGTFLPLMIRLRLNEKKLMKYWKITKCCDLWIRLQA